MCVSPMLAKIWQSSKHDLKHVKQLMCSPKLDGFRCVANEQGIYSRNGIRFRSCEHIALAVQKLLKQNKNKYYLDGELYHPKDKCFERVLTVVKKKSSQLSPEDILLEHNITFHVFDLIEARSPTRLPFLERHRLLRDLVTTEASEFIQLVPHHTVRSENELENKLDTYLEQGYEGLIVRTLDGKYEIGKRSIGLMKYVPVAEAEFDIYDVKPSLDKKTVGALCCTTPMGKKFNVALGIDRSVRLQWWSMRSQLIGKKATVRFQRYGSGGVPRFPIVKSIRNMQRMKV